MRAITSVRHFQNFVSSFFIAKRPFVSMGVTVAEGERHECDEVPLELVRQSLGFPIATNIIAKNRLIKAPMIEMLGSFDANNMTNTGIPTEALINLNRKFAEGGCGINILGGIIISEDAIEGGEDTGAALIAKELDCAERKKQFQLLAATAVDGSLIVAQILHPGRRVVRLKNNCPPFDVNTATPEQFEDLIDRHVFAAEYLKNCGFHGVEINVSLDFALGQMVTADMNERTDDYGGPLKNRTRVIFQIIRKIRERINDDNNFVIGMKLNSPNYEPMFDENEFAEYCSQLDDAKLDYVLLAGGHYKYLEKLGADMLDSSKKREAFFLHFASLTRKYLKKVKIIICGGFVSAEQIYEAINGNTADAVAMARTLAAEPNLPCRMLSEEIFSAKKSIISDLDYRKRKNAAGMQLWQHGNDKVVLDLTNELHIEAFLQTLSKHDTSRFCNFGYPRLCLEQ